MNSKSPKKLSNDKNKSIEEIENIFITNKDENKEDFENIFIENKNEKKEDFENKPDKVWTEKDAIEEEIEQMSDLLGLNTEYLPNNKKQEQVEKNNENNKEIKQKIPEILFKRKKYKGRKKKR